MAKLDFDPTKLSDLSMRVVRAGIAINAASEVMRMARIKEVSPINGRNIAESVSAIESFLEYVTQEIRGVNPQLDVRRMIDECLADPALQAVMKRVSAVSGSPETVSVTKGLKRPSKSVKKSKPKSQPDST